MLLWHLCWASYGEVEDKETILPVSLRQVREPGREFYRWKCGHATALRCVRSATHREEKPIRKTRVPR